LIWGLGIGDWGFGIAITNPQSPIPIICYKTTKTNK